MRTRLRFALGRLASVEFQRRFCVGATRDQYVVPWELLQSAVNGVEVTLAQPILRSTYNSAELNALCEFLDVANALPMESGSLSWKELVENDPEWNRLRAAAHKCADTLDLRVTLEELLSRQ